MVLFGFLRFLLAHSMPLIEDPENGEKEWLQMVAELESRKN